ncbi:MAG: hypothetical protein N4A53_00200 [Pelagimonas sp.]|jgi:hypothetical protein|nr:hypothetical protein [Pelagimonas sp.]
MRAFAPLCLTACLIAFSPLPSFAEEDKTASCDSQVEIVMSAVQKRLDGQRKGKTKRELRKDLGRTAGDMLADFIYSVPEDQLGDQIGEAYRAQCEAM